MVDPSSWANEKLPERRVPSGALGTPVAAHHSSFKCCSAKLVTNSALYLRDTALAKDGYGWLLDLISRGNVPMCLSIGNCQ